MAGHVLRLLELGEDVLRKHLAEFYAHLVCERHRIR